MALNQNHVGLHISSTKLQLVEVVKINKHYNLENVDEEYFSDFFRLNEKETKLITILQNAFNEITLRNPLNSATISLTLPSNEFRIFDIPYDDALTKNDLEEHINWELSLLLPNVKLHSLTRQIVKIENSKLRKTNNLIIFTALKRTVKLLNKFCRRNSLTLRYIDNEHLSANNLLYHQHQLEAEKNYLTVLIKDNYFSIVLLENRLPVYMNVCRYKGASELLAAMRKELDNLSRRFEGYLDVEGSFIFGDAYSNSLIESIESNSGLELHSVDPFLHIKKNKTIESKLHLLDDAGTYCSAAGIAYRLV